MNENIWYSEQSQAFAQWIFQGEYATISITKEACQTWFMSALMPVFVLRIILNIYIYIYINHIWIMTDKRYK